jgi:hypothetical protein
LSVKASTKGPSNKDMNTGEACEITSRCTRKVCESHRNVKLLLTP